MKIYKTNVQILVSVLAILISGCLSGCSSLSRSTPEATVQLLVESTLNSDYESFVSCCTTEGFKRVGLGLETKQQFINGTKSAKTNLISYSVEVQERSPTQAVVNFTAYAIERKKGIRQITPFEVIKVGDKWLIQKLRPIVETPFPIDKFPEKK